MATRIGKLVAALLPATALVVLSSLQVWSQSPVIGPKVVAFARPPRLSAAQPQTISKNGLGMPRVVLPLQFEQNRGQFDSNVLFMARTGGLLLYLTQNETV